MVRIKRAYEEPARSDGFRVLVDRLWPRGVKKEELRLDLWAKELAPSPELRRWFGHEPDRFREFAARYLAELRSERARALLADLARRAARGTVTLVYGARDEQHNGAVVLRDAIDSRPATSTSSARGRREDRFRASASRSAGWPRRTGSAPSRSLH